MISTIQNNTAINSISALFFNEKTNLRHSWIPSFHSTDKISEIFKEKKLPFLQELLQSMAHIESAYQTITTPEAKKSLHQSISLIQASKYKKDGYIRRLFSSENWKEWSDHRTDLGRVLSTLEDESGMERAWKRLDPSIIENSERIAQEILQNIPQKKSQQRRLTSISVDGACVTEPTGLQIDTSTLPPTANSVYSRQTYMVSGASVGAQNIRNPIISLTISGFSPSVSFFQVIPASADYIPINPIMFTVPEGYNGPIQLAFHCSNSGGVDFCFHGVANIQPDLGPMPKPPVAMISIPNQKAFVGQLFDYNLPLTPFSDPQQSPLSITSTQANGAPLPIWLYFSETSFSGTPNSLNTGNLPIILIARNKYDQTTTIPFEIQVIHINPQLNIPIPDQKAAVGALFSYEVLSNTFIDSSGNFLTYTATQTNQKSLPSWLSFQSQTFTGIPTLENVGIYSITVTANDGYQGTSSDTFQIFVQHILPQVLNPIADTICSLGQYLTITIPENTFFDPAGNPLTLSASQSNQSPLPSWLKFNPNSKMFSGNPTSANPSFFSILVTASDPFNGTVSASFKIDIQHILPIATNPISDQIAAVQVPFSFTLPKNIFFDSVGNPLTFSATLENGDPIPKWLIFNPLTQTFTGTPQIQDVNSLPIQVTAADPYNGTAKNYFSLAIENMIPELNHPIPDQSIMAQEPFIFSIPSNTFSNPAKAELRLIASQINEATLPIWLLFNPESQILSGTPTTQDEQKPYQIKITAINQYQQNISDVFAITVQKTPWNTSLLLDGLKYGGASLLLGTILGLIVSKRKRLRKTQETISNLEIPLASLSALSISDLRTQLAQLNEQINLGAFNEYDQSVSSFIHNVSAYFQSQPNDCLFDLLEIDEFITKITKKTYDKLLRNHSNETILTLSRSIQQFCELIILIEVSNSRKINEEVKSQWIRQLDNINSRIDTKQKDQTSVEVKFNIEMSMEALKCIQDTATTILFLKRCLFHIISPGELFGDFKALMGDLPSKWYPLLLFIQTLTPQATQDLAKLKKLQKLITTQNDWRFFYKIISILATIAKETPHADIRNQAINGSAHEPGLKFFMNFSPYKVRKERNTWIQQKSKKLNSEFNLI